jgi:hypothetical protein
MTQKAAIRNLTPKEIHALCTYCGKDIPTPELRVTVGKRMKSMASSY